MRSAAEAREAPAVVGLRSVALGAVSLQTPLLASGRRGRRQHDPSPTLRSGKRFSNPPLQFCFSLPSLLSFSIMHKFSILDSVSEY